MTLARDHLRTDILAGVVGRPVRHNDIERGAWVDGAIAAGVVPADYGACSTG